MTSTYLVYMADITSGVIIAPDNPLCTNLPDVVASMEMLTVDAANSVGKQLAETTNPRKRYEMRKRLPQAATTEILNRRCSQRPKKRSYSTMESDEDIKEYYLDKNVKKKPNTTLETIHEEIDGMSDSAAVITGRKLRRLIQFSHDSKFHDAKIKKRKAKVKKIFGSKFKLKSTTVTMQALVKKLHSIRSETPSTGATRDKQCNYELKQ